MPKGRVVWILGAGFSVGVGGPLLRDLFGKRAKEELLRNYSDLMGPRAESQAGSHVFALYDQGIQRGLWKDAEQFLDFLDTAAYSAAHNEATGAHFEIIDSLCEPVSVTQTRDLAVRLMAAQCHVTRYANLKMEAWQPYVRWFTEILLDTDRILTFNYDLVLEKLNDIQKGQVNFRVQGPTGYELRRFDVPVYKLHGSVNWDRNLRLFEKEPQDHLDEEVPLLAVPGPTKRDMTMGKLEVIWNRAMHEIKTADAVVFVGYRFPPTDAVSRSRILEALSENESDVLEIHTVLGPDTHDPYTRRMDGLLKAGLQRDPSTQTKVHIHPLFAEDFLALCQRHDIIGSGRRI